MKNASNPSLFSGRPPRIPTSSRPPRPPQTHLFRPPVYRRPRTKDPYIPPFRLRRITESEHLTTSNEAGQKRVWTTMKKRINKIINIVNSDNVASCAKALFRLNLIRARGVFVKTLLRVQLASPDLSPVFACLIAVIGSRLPQVTELLVGRLIAQLKAAYANQDRVLCFATARFIAHLYNQHVVTDLLLFEFLTTCTLDPSDSSIELAVTTLKECSVLLSEESPVALDTIFQSLRKTLYDADISKRVQVMIERLIETRRRATTDNVLDPRLDLLHTEDIITHFMSLDDEDKNDLEYECNNFLYDPYFDENEREYEAIKRDILGAEADFATLAEPGVLSDPPKTPGNGEIDGTSAGTPSSLSSPKNSDKLKDMTEAEPLDFRRTVYLTISSGLSYEEWAHKLLKLMENHSNMELQLCQMIVECCSQEKTYLRAFGLLGQRLCILKSNYISKFEELFATHYGTIHRFDITRIRNMAGFYASLFASDVLPWTMFAVVRIVENETTSSSRIFLKVLFEEIAYTLGKGDMKKHFVINSDQGNLDGVLPKDNVDNARFAIKFFQAIGLGYVTDDLQSKLESLPNSSHKDNKEDSSSLSSSVSSSSSSSLSESSGLDAVDQPRVPSESASKRGQNESSLDPSHRPIKLRRKTKDNRSDEESPLHGYSAESSRDYKEATERQRYKDDKNYANRSADVNNLHSSRFKGARSGRRLASCRGLSDDENEANIDGERYRLRCQEKYRESRQGRRGEKSRFGIIEPRERRNSFSGRRNESGRDTYRDGNYYLSTRSKELPQDHGHLESESVRYCSDRTSSDEDVRHRSQSNRRYNYDERRLSNHGSRSLERKSHRRRRRDYKLSSESEDCLSLRSRSSSPRGRRKNQSRPDNYQRSRSHSASLDSDCKKRER